MYLRLGRESTTNMTWGIPELSEGISLLSAINVHVLRVRVRDARRLYGSQLRYFRPRRNIPRYFNEMSLYVRRQPEKDPDRNSQSSGPYKKSIKSVTHQSYLINSSALTIEAEINDLASAHTQTFNNAPKFDFGNVWIFFICSCLAI